MSSMGRRSNDGSVVEIFDDGAVCVQRGCDGLQVPFSWTFHTQLCEANWLALSTLVSELMKIKL